MSVVNDFGGFDRKQFEDLWLFRGIPGSTGVENKRPLPLVAVFALSWYRGRELARTVLHLDFDGLRGEKFDEGETLEPGDIVVIENTKGVPCTFEATRTVSRDEARRGEGLRKWEPVEFTRGREERPASRGVQADGQAAVHPQTTDASSAPSESNQDGKASRVGSPVRDRGK